MVLFLDTSLFTSAMPFYWSTLMLHDEIEEVKRNKTKVLVTLVTDGSVAASEL